MTADHGTQQSFFWTFTAIRYRLQDHKLIVRAESEDAHGHMEIEKRGGATIHLYAFCFERNGDIWMCIECPGFFKFESAGFDVRVLDGLADSIWLRLDLISRKEPQ